MTDPRYRACRPGIVLGSLADEPALSNASGETFTDIHRLLLGVPTATRPRRRTLCREFGPPCSHPDGRESGLPRLCCAAGA